MASDEELARFNAERDEALLSMDETKIREFVRKWNGKEMPQHPTAFWGAVHKTITGRANLPMEFRVKSYEWLQEHNMESYDDGDVAAAAKK